MRRNVGRIAALLLATAPIAVPAQEAPRSAPEAVPVVDTIPAARDTPWPGTLSLDVDATDIRRGVFRVKETIPVAPGTTSLTLLYPEWLPGHHAPRGPLQDLADLQFQAGGKALTWRRDTVEVHAFHVDVPPGTGEVIASFVFTSPLQTSEGRIVMTPEMLNLQWEAMSLYPAGHYVRRIRVKPSATFPPGWTAATALDGKQVSGDRVTWAEVDYETLVDSPIFAGLYFKRWDLGGNVALDAVADAPEQLDAKPEQIAAYARLVEEATIAFGGRHYDHYDFLLALSDRMGGIGLEHHRSSENQLEPEAFTQWGKNEWERALLPHEFTHSWNGKFRRPARLWTPDYRTPMQDDLLWVYEGQTQFWGMVLAARSGLMSYDMVLANLATIAGSYVESPGRQWRAVEDTTADPIVSARRPRPFASISRNEDYYNEGALVWLEADQIIREGTKGQRGLDDFARIFFGQRNPGSASGAGPGSGSGVGVDWGVSTYERADVIAALNAVYRYDWDSFIKARIGSPGQPAPTEGLEKAGYRLVWKAQPNVFDAARMDDNHGLNLYHSLGIGLDKDGLVTSARWDGPAFNAGLVTGAKIVAVNGTAYDPDRLKAAITAAKGGTRPIDLLIRRGDRYLTVSVPWYGGLRWPWLERTRNGSSVPMDRLLAPRRVPPNAGGRPG